MDDLKENQEKDSTPEDIAGIRRLIEHVFPRSKEYNKFILGLATGTLVFSVTFIDNIAPSPEHKWIVLLGWISLLVSIISAVELLRINDTLVSLCDGLIDWLQNPAKLINSVVKPSDNLERRVFRSVLSDDLIKSILLKKQKEEKEISQEDISKYRDELLADKKIRKSTRKMLKGFPDTSLFSILNAMLKLAWLDKLSKKYAHPARQIRKLNRSIWKLIIIDYIFLWSFYIGILSISIFGIINYF